MIRSVLLTGTRAPVTLDLARRLACEGIRVIGADCCRYPVGRFSPAFAAHYRVPPVRWQGDEWVEQLDIIVSREQIDVVWPTCEEVFHLSARRERLSSPVLLPSDDVLLRLHHKLRFAQWTHEMGGDVTAPPSWEAREAPAGEPLIWKPKYSRFGTRVRTGPPPGDLEPWMAQRLSEGPEFCGWALCRDGEIYAATQYRCLVRAKRGAGYCFEPVWSGEVETFMRRIVRLTNYTGSISFDFMGPDRDGRIFVLECNPRMTSGLHVLNPAISLKRFLDDEREGAPTNQRNAQIYLLTLLRAPRLADPRLDVMAGCSLLGQIAALTELGAIACRHGISLNEAATWDLEYNGE